MRSSDESKTSLITNANNGAMMQEQQKNEVIHAFAMIGAETERDHG